MRARLPGPGIALNVLARAALRRRPRDPIVSQTDFSTLPLNPDLLSNLASLDYHQMTPIQASSLPDILAGRDVIGQGKTGSGKTAAFGLGVLNKLDVKRFRVQTLVLCPTRELADQVAKELRKLARSIHNIKILTLCGGMPFGPQIGSLEHGAHIVVGTPGRIEEHLRKGTLILENVDTLVLDEADRMLDMGFQPALDAILAYVPKSRQTLLFSATFPDQIKQLADYIMVDPLVVKVEARHDSNSIAQSLFRVGNDDNRLDALLRLLAHHQPVSAVVFCNTRAETLDVADALNAAGHSAIALNGDLDQRQRDESLVTFANKSVSVLVATDVAARGLDIEDLDAVINYRMALDPEIHVHRIGRTGRAGSQGIACTLFSDREGHRLADLEGYLNTVFEPEALPAAVHAHYRPQPAPMITVQIDGGKKQKVRPGDVLGALTGEQGIDGSEVGKISVFDQCTYVAVARGARKRAVDKLGRGRIKGRSFRVRVV
jgi:ATP-independent RNA helicase DbpA